MTTPKKISIFSCVLALLLKEITLFVHGVSTAPFIRELREQLETDIAVSEEVIKPFKLGSLAKVKAVVGEYVW